MSLISAYINRTFAKGDKARDAGLSTPDDVIRYDDISYGTAEKWHLLDVYRPKETEGKLPVIVSVHGGGWVYGDKEVYQFYGMSLAQRGFVVMNFNYRLAPKYRYPAQVEDLNAVIHWMLKNGEKYGFDLNNVFAVGDSAGGHLLSVYTAILTNPAYRTQYQLELPEGFCFNAVALNCGIYRQEKPKKKDLSSLLLNDVLPKGWQQSDLDRMNSYDKLTPDFPPVYLMSATGDFLRPQADILKEQLEKNGIEYVMKIYGSQSDALPHVFHVNIRFKAADECNTEECEFFRKHLK